MGGYVPKDAGERGWEGMSLRKRMGGRGNEREGMQGRGEVEDQSVWVTSSLQMVNLSQLLSIISFVPN